MGIHCHLHGQQPGIVCPYCQQEKLLKEQNRLLTGAPDPNVIPSESPKQFLRGLFWQCLIFVIAGPLLVSKGSPVHEVLGPGLKMMPWLGTLANLVWAGALIATPIALIASFFASDDIR